MLNFADKYRVLDNGVVKEINIRERCPYDLEYTESRYVRNITEMMAANMAFLRLGNVIGALGHIPRSILDVGYGSGSFLKAAAEIIKDVNGYDIPPAFPIDSNKIVIQNSMYSRHYEVVTFFDSLEHFPDIYEIKNLDADYIYISCPWCHFEENHDEDAFMSWKHKRGGEHLWHFGIQGLSNFMAEIGFEYIMHSNIEDAIRKPIRNEANILSALFKKMRNDDNAK